MNRHRFPAGRYARHSPLSLVARSLVPTSRPLPLTTTVISSEKGLCQCSSPELKTKKSTRDRAGAGQINTIPRRSYKPNQVEPDPHVTD